MGALLCRILVYLRSVSGPGLAQELAFMDDATTVPKLAAELLQRRMSTNIILVKACDHPFRRSLFLERSNWSQYGPELSLLQPANYEGSYPKRHQRMATRLPRT